MDGDCDGAHNTDDDEKSKINKMIGSVKSTQRAEENEREKRNEDELGRRKRRRKKKNVKLDITM